MESRLLRPTKARDAQMKSALETRHGAERLASTSPPPMHFGRMESFSQAPSPSPPPAAHHQRRTTGPGGNQSSSTNSAGRNNSRLLSVPSSFNRSTQSMGGECRRSQAPPNASSLGSCPGIPASDEVGGVSVRPLAPLQRNSPAPAPQSALPCYRAALALSAASRKRAREEVSSSSLSAPPLRSRAPTRTESVPVVHGDPESCSSTFSPREKPQRAPLALSLSALRHSSPRDGSRGRATRLTDVTVSTVSDECDDADRRNQSRGLCDTSVDGSISAPFSVVLDSREVADSRLRKSEGNTEHCGAQEENVMLRTSDVLSTSDDDGPSTIGGISSIDACSSVVVAAVAAAHPLAVKQHTASPAAVSSSVATDSRAATEIHEAMEAYNAASMIRLTENFSDLERRWAELYRKGECRDTQQILTERQTLPEFSCDSNVFHHLGSESVVVPEAEEAGQGDSSGVDGAVASERMSTSRTKKRDLATGAHQDDVHCDEGTMCCSATVSPPSKYRTQQNSTSVAEHGDESYSSECVLNTGPTRNSLSSAARSSSFSPSGATKRRTNGTTGRPALLRPLSTPPGDDDLFAAARASVSLLVASSSTPTAQRRGGGRHFPHRQEQQHQGDTSTCSSSSTTVDVGVQTWARGSDVTATCDVESAASLLGINREVATYMMRTFGRVLVQPTPATSAGTTVALVATPPPALSGVASAALLPGGLPPCLSAQRSANGSPLLMDDNRIPSVRNEFDAELMRESVVHRIVYHSAEPLPEPHTSEPQRRYALQGPTGFTAVVPTPVKRTQR